MRSGHLECPFIGLKPKLAQAHMCMSNIRSIWGRIVCHMVKGREGLSALISQHLSSVTSEQMNLLISEKVSPGYVNKYKCQFHFQNFQIATQVPTTVFRLYGQNALPLKAGLKVKPSRTLTSQGLGCDLFTEVPNVWKLILEGKVKVPLVVIHQDVLMFSPCLTNLPREWWAALRRHLVL